LSHHRARFTARGRWAVARRVIEEGETFAQAAALTGEVVAPADELVKAFAATLVARPQAQRTYERACKRFARWLVGDLELLASVLTHKGRPGGGAPAVASHEPARYERVTCSQLRPTWSDGSAVTLSLLLPPHVIVSVSPSRA